MLVILYVNVFQIINVNQFNFIRFRTSITIVSKISQKKKKQMLRNIH